MSMMSKRAKEFAQDFSHNESGATAVEYCLIASLVCIGIVVAAGTIGSEIGGFFVSMGEWFGGVTVP